MKEKIIYFVMALITVITADNAESRLSQSRALFYSEIGCIPLDESGSSYECPNYKQVINKNKCIFRGEEYDLGVELPKFGEPCQRSCRCMKQGEVSKFSCSIHVECVQELNTNFNPVVPGNECIRTYENGGCCPTITCDAELESLHKCEFQGETFYEGQIMFPAGDCSACSCVKGFDNSTVVGNPHCRQDRCNILENNIHEIFWGCAPIYYENACCPFQFRCPTATDFVISQGRPETGVCTFGDLKVGVGGEINSNTYRTTCFCVAPPFIECLQTPIIW